MMSKYTTPLFLGIVLFFPLPNAYSKSADLKIVVDPRVELLAVVQTLSNYDEEYGLLTDYDFPYRRDVALFFSPLKEHSAVKLFQKMSPDSFSFDAPPTLMLHLSNPPQLQVEASLTDYLVNRGGGEEQLSEFLESLRDFARTSQFEFFWDSHRGTYEEMVTYVQKQIEGNVLSPRVLGQ